MSIRDWTDPRRLSGEQLRQTIRQELSDARDILRSIKRSKTPYQPYVNILSSLKRSYKGGNLPTARQVEKMDTRQLQRLYSQIANLGSMPTPKEARAEVLERAKTFYAKVGIPATPQNLSAQALDKLRRFLHSDDWKKAMAFGSGDAMDVAADAVAKARESGKNSLNALRDAFREFSLQIDGE